MEGLAFAIGIVISATLIVAALDHLGVDASRKQNPTESSYRAACSQVKGTVVWNGRNWECLK